MLHIQSLEALEERLTDFIQASYMDVATDLKRDIRIFTAVNAGVFMLLLLVSFLKPQAVRHLFVPGLLLGVAFLFLCDIVLNRGRVTTRLANGLAGAVGGTFSLIPC